MPTGAGRCWQITGVAGEGETSSSGKEIWGEEKGRVHQSEFAECQLSKQKGRLQSRRSQGKE